MTRFLLHLGLSAVSVTVVSRLLPGFHVNNFVSALSVAAVYGILDTLFFNLLRFIFAVPNFFTFGLFSFVISAFLLFMTEKLLDDFKIDSLMITLVAAVLLTLLNGVWRWLFF